MRFFVANFSNPIAAGLKNLLEPLNDRYYKFAQYPIDKSTQQQIYPSFALEDATYEIYFLIAYVIS